MPSGIPTTRSFWPRTVPGFVGPSVIDDIAVPVTPLEGLDAYSKIIAASVSDTNVNQVDATAVPAGKQWFIPAAGGYHTDPASNPSMCLQLVHPDGKFVPIYAMGDQAGGMPANWYFASNRPIILPQLWTLRLALSSTIAVATSLVLRFAYVEVPLGEYVPGI